jgi:hypothetical protein
MKSAKKSEYKCQNGGAYSYEYNRGQDVVHAVRMAVSNCETDQELPAQGKFFIGLIDERL